MATQHRDRRGRSLLAYSYFYFVFAALLVLPAVRLLREWRQYPYSLAGGLSEPDEPRRPD